jgi:nucleotide-binding universal stress UspA family protein
LIFLHISNVQFLEGLASPVLIDIETEMEHLGEFILAMAQERAQKQGIPAEAIVESGSFLDILSTVIEKESVDTVVLGSPGEDTGVLTGDFVERVTQVLTEESGVDVIILTDGQITSQFQAKAESET